MIDEPHLTVVENTPPDAGEGEDELPVVPASVAEEIAEQDAGRRVRMAEELRLLEALIFASAEPISERVIGERLGEGADVPGLLEQLRAIYQGRGVELLQANGRWSFRTAPDLVDRLALEKLVPRKLSRAAIETLAIVAYHQPVTRAEIEEIRGVIVSTGTIDILLEEGWLKPRGRKQVPGRPVMWGTSNAFLDHFGLESIEDLPGIDELRAAGLLDNTRGASYSTRGADTLLFDTEEADETAEPLATGEEGEDAGEGAERPETAVASGEAAEEADAEEDDDDDDDDYEDDDDDGDDDDGDDEDEDGADEPDNKAS